MGEAREVLNRVTDAMVSHNPDALADCYAENAVAVTPEQGELSGREAVCAYLAEFLEAFPDFTYEYLQQHEAGNWAIDEGYFGGTNTGPLVMPSGEALAATGKRIRVRGCDFAQVEGGRIVVHRFYYDQMEALGQLGLLTETAT
jgi:predicted ester cyclase